MLYIPVEVNIGVRALKFGVTFWGCLTEVPGFVRFRYMYFCQVFNSFLHYVNKVKFVSMMTLFKPNRNVLLGKTLDTAIQLTKWQSKWPSSLIVTCSVPNHYLNQCWMHYYLALWEQISIILIQGNDFEIIIHKMVAILSASVSWIRA